MAKSESNRYFTSGLYLGHSIAIFNKKYIDFKRKNNAL